MACLSMHCVLMCRFSQYRCWDRFVWKTLVKQDTMFSLVKVIKSNEALFAYQQMVLAQKIM